MDETRHIGSFVATNAGGIEYTVEIFQDFQQVQTRGGVHIVPKLKSLFCNGNPVNRIAQGKYKIIGRGIILKSSDPNAP